MSQKLQSRRFPNCTTFVGKSLVGRANQSLNHIRPYPWWALPTYHAMVQAHCTIDLMVSIIKKHHGNHTGSTATTVGSVLALDKC